MTNAPIGMHAPMTFHDKPVSATQQLGQSACHFARSSHAHTTYPYGTRHHGPNSHAGAFLTRKFLMSALLLVGFKRYQGACNCICPEGYGGARCEQLTAQARLEFVFPGKTLYDVVRMPVECRNLCTGLFCRGSIWHHSVHP